MRIEQNVITYQDDVSMSNNTKVVETKTRATRSWPTLLSVKIKNRFDSVAFFNNTCVYIMS